MDLDVQPTLPVATQDRPVAHTLGTTRTTRTSYQWGDDDQPARLMGTAVGMCHVLLCAEVLQAKAKVHRMGLRVFDSKHDWVYAIFKPVLKSQIKKAMERAVEDYMKDYLQVSQ